MGMTITGGITFAGGMTMTALPAAANGSALFNGTTQYLSLATNAALNFGTGDFTVEGWVLPNSLANDSFIISAAGTGGFFFGQSPNSPNGWGWGRAEVAWDYRVAGNATVGVWQHVAVTRSGTSMRLFVNGTQSGVTQTIATAYNLGTTSTTVGSQGTNYYLNGNISNLRVVKGVAVYTANFTPSTTNLTATQSANINGNPSAAISGTQTSLLLNTYSGAGFLTDASTNAFVLTNVNTVTSSALTPFT